MVNFSQKNIFSERNYIFGYIDPTAGFTITSSSGWIIVLLLGLWGGFLIFAKKIFKFFKKHKKLFFIILALIITIILVLTLFMNKKISTFNNKIIILGFDGLSPNIVDEMMADGSLPNFSLLKEQGFYRRLSTTNPSQSPVAWTGFATGQNPGKNGIFDFIVRNPNNYELTLADSIFENGKPQRAVKTKSFWQYLSGKNVPSIILNCPVTFPPDKINGRMISGMGVPDIIGTEGTFTFYTSESSGDTEDTGGKVFQVQKQPAMQLNLVGPMVKGLDGKTENKEVSFNIILDEQKNSALVSFQGNKSEIKVGEWSQWQKVTFDTGLFKKANGIFKFYLVEISPEFKLFISPINFDPQNPLFDISYPKNYSKQLADAIGLYHTQGMPMDTWALNEGRLDEKAFLEEVEEVQQEKEKMLYFELDRLQSGVLFSYFETPDVIQHMFWRYIDPEHPLYDENADPEYKKTIKNWYIRMDKVLGEVIKKLGKNDTLFVLSDHGFSTFRRTVNINAWLRANGYLELKNPSASQGGELLSDIDWSKTKAYAIGFGSIYINQKGREKNGIIEPGRETELLKKEISDKLKNWQDDKYSAPVINNVYFGEDIFKGEYAKTAPDLFVGFNIGYRASWQTALGAVPENLLEDNLKKWSGDHLFDPVLVPAIFFSNKKIITENPSIYDISPTVLKITGFSDEEIQKLNFDGKPLF